MKTITVMTATPKLSFGIITIFFWTINIFAQMDTVWVQRYDGIVHGEDMPATMVLDDFGNVYIAGSSSDAVGGYDCVTIKYSSMGEELWAHTYSGSANGPLDMLSDIALDHEGNVYVCGRCQEAGTGCDYLVIKYSPQGETLWVRKYGEPFRDGATGIALGPNGDVFVTGNIKMGPGYLIDWLTLKYSSAGSLLIMTAYDGPEHSQDIPTDIAIDDSDYVYVTGWSQENTGFYFDCSTVKYTSALETVWTKTWGTSGAWDVVNAMVLDGSGNVCITGATETNFLTIKYSSAGDLLWARTYNGSGNSTDEAKDIAVDDANNIYVTGVSVEPVGTYNYCTIKYSPAGDMLWVKTYNSPNNASDEANAITIDDSNDIYVTGVSGQDYATIKYDTYGNELWVVRYNGPGNAYDSGRDIEVDTQGNICVVGTSTGIGTEEDICTIKYGLEPGIEEGFKKQMISPKTSVVSDITLEPNPSFGRFFLRTTLSYRVFIKLKLYDSSGREVKTLFTGCLPVGVHCLEIETKTIPSGTYWIRLETNGVSKVEKGIFIH